MATAALQPFARETFQSYAISASGFTGIGKARLCAEADTLDQCLALTPHVHKAHIAVRHTDTLTGAVMLKFFVIKRKSRGERRYHEYQTRVIHDLYAEHLFDLAAGEL